jgi:S1-C subfamily serine protease
MKNKPFTLLIVLILIALGFWYILRPGRHLLDSTAQPRSVIARGSLAEDEKNTIEIFESVAPSVVYITSIELRQNLFTLNVYAIPKGTGSGIVWDSNGYIVTNFHVIEDAGRVEVTLADATKWKAAVVGVAPDKDVAVLKVSAPSSALHPIPLGESGNLRVGQKVYAIGNPFGLDHTLTTGIVSALGREIESITGQTIQGMIQTDAAINPGNSGGPLLDSAGRLIGINTAIYSPSGVSAGIGFAVPADTVNRTVPEIIRYGRVIKPGIGVSIAGDAIARRMGIKGVLIINVQPGSNAQAAGLRGTLRRNGEFILGDVITGVNDRTISSYDDLRNELDRYHVGDQVTLVVVREGRQIQVNVRLEEAG